MIREFQKIAERGGYSQAIGEALLAPVRRLFAGWARVRDGTLSRAAWADDVVTIRADLRCGLAHGADYDPGPGHSAPEGSSRAAHEVEAPHPSLQLRPGEAAHLREWAALVAIRDWPGYDERMAIDAAAVQKWIDERCALLHKLIRSDSAKDNKRLCRQQRLTALEHHRGVSLGPAVLPTAACTASEKAHIAMREAYIGFTITSPESIAMSASLTTSRMLRLKAAVTPSASSYS